MLRNVLILFGNPIDSDVFDRHSASTFEGLLHTIPNVEKITLNQIAGAAHGESPYYLIVDLQFSSDDAMQEGLNSEAGQVMAADLSAFATGGVSVLFAQVAVESIDSTATTE